MDKVSKNRFWSVVEGRPLRPVRPPSRARQLISQLRPFKENPCVQIHLDQPNYAHTCACGVVYPCDKHGQCVISLRTNGKIRSCLTCPDYQPHVAPASIITRLSGPLQWSVGVTTANRPDPDHRFHKISDERGWQDRTHPLNWTLRSIGAAGWPDPVVFAEPGCYRPSDGYGQWVEQAKPLGAWNNWKAALHQLCHDKPEAEAILLIQDDVIFCRGLREFLESMLWPDNVGAVSLYCSARYANGGGLIRWGGRGFWGACALLFHRDRAIEIVHSSVARRRSGNKIDISVGQWCNQTGRNLWLFTPSLAQHTGEFRSSLRHGGGKLMRASDFVGEDFDARTLIKRRRVSIAMPVFGCGDLAERSIDALAKFTDRSAVTLWLVDDVGPRDDWSQALAAAERSGLAIKVISHETNLGFTPAINRVIAESGRDNVLILNSDAYICSDVVGVLSAHLDRNPKIGCIGPQEYRLDTKGPYNDIRLRDQYQGYWGRLPYDAEQVANELQRLVEFEPKRVLSYFCTLLRREALDDVGPLDSRLPSGLAADNLHCDQLRAKGWLVGVAHDGLALHQGSASFKRAGLPKRRIQRDALAVYNRISQGVV